MASRALMARFNRALSSWLASTKAVQRSAASFDCNVDVLAQGAAKQVFHARDQAIDIVRPGVKRLAASECKKPMRERAPRDARMWMPRP